ncbi:molybdate ABC transporter substrate-binding protein [Pseudorhodobacter ferrugineus]|uniref:molybdate ABC transporter substrate-binding protein n=1 Tax=Pseudorhodobacter ferrugineus TaxID=77008 RepID=UPI0003B53ECB|nr:molybdate ABC transporter substrate-binding protein [Pseudorhodobacter ferrugineus]
MLHRAALLICLALPLQAKTAQAETALAAVAANFADAAQTLATQFQAETGHSIEITTGSTGKLYAQITQGAPYDLLLSADAATPARLYSDGHGRPQPYAIGILTLWAPNMPINTDPTVTLQSDQIRHIAIANPDLAPYGQAAMQALTAMGLEGAIADKIVMGQNIGQTFALVDSGAAEAGLVARSALTNPKGYVWDVPANLYPPIQQHAILLTHGANNPAATAFLAYLTTPQARAIIANSGYALP